MNNFNDYNEISFRESFSSTKIYRHLVNDFDILSWEKNFLITYDDTPRFVYGGPRRFSVVPFYYLEKLTEKNPKEIYDLGCGWNIFKKYIPEIIGVGAENNLKFYYGDIHDSVDDAYVLYHKEAFESVFSINSLHFMSIEYLEKILNDFVSMVKTGGRGFIALNVQRMLERTPAKFLTSAFDTQHPSPNAVTIYVKNILSQINCNFLIVDVDFSKGFDDAMDGNIRLVFEK